MFEHERAAALRDQSLYACCRLFWTVGLYLVYSPAANLLRHPRGGQTVEIQPCLLNGKPMKIETQITVVFQLNEQ